MYCTGWVEPKSPKDGPVKTVCREASWEENRAGLGWGVGQRPGEKEGPEAVAGQGMVKGSIFVLETWFHVAGLDSNSLCS